MPLALVVALTAATTFADQEATDAYASALLSIARSIEALKPEYAQLVEFSASANLDGLKITYGHRTERAARTGGWTSGVPSPTEGGVWFYIDLHDPDSTAQIHTQPAVPRYRFRDMRVMLLVREGPNAKPLEAALVRVLLDHGVEPVERRAVRPVGDRLLDCALTPAPQRIDDTAGYW
jgi:hypothetical protein